jgi:two-component system, chemotaxis family, chemotaxis protein CheY
MSKRILVVDDDADVLEVMRIVLEGAGYEVLAATDGEEALALLRGDAKPGLIFLDLMMPRMNGMQFIARAQEEGLLNAIPVIAISGGSSRREGVLALGAAEYLSKPLELNILLGTAAKYC